MRIFMRYVVIPYTKMPCEIVKPPSKGWIIRTLRVERSGLEEQDLDAAVSSKDIRTLRAELTRSDWRCIVREPVPATAAHDWMALRSRTSLGPLRGEPRRR